MNVARVPIVVCLVLLLSPPSLAELARGTVFEDLDGNGTRSRTEPGVAGVAVSNGRDVVQTDDSGRYRIEVSEGAILFVTQPAGYTVPHDADNLPRFYYIHDPDGTPADLGLRYRGLEPSGPLPEAVDFPLRRVAQPERFEVLLFSDTQPQTRAEIDYIRDDVVAELVGSNAAFGLTLGDIVYDDLSMYSRYNAVIGQIGIPWHNVPGNHDLNYLVPEHGNSRETFKRHFGPPYYSFEYGRAHFVVLDDVHYLGSNAGRDRPHPRGAGGYEGRIDGDQLTWLTNDLRLVPADRLIVLTMHIPLHTIRAPGSPGVNVLELDGLFDALDGHARVFALAGHLHTTEHEYLGEAEGWGGDEPLHQHVISTVAGSWWSGPFDERGIPTAVQSDGTPNGYHVMTVDGTEVSVRYKAASRPADYQMRISLDADHHRYRSEGMRDYRMGELLGGSIHVDQVHSTQVVVNLFDGGPRSELSYRIGDRPPVTMRRVYRNDPYVEELFLRFESSKKSFVQVEPSSHIWVARLPLDLGPGVHTLSVQATDEYGQRHEAHKLFEVVSHGR